MARIPSHDTNLDIAFNSLEVSDSDDQLIIALDFGTTFSGIAYCFSGQGKLEAESIRDYPGHQGRNDPKTPTLICYNAQNKFTWASEVDVTSANKLEGIKLLLDPDQTTPLYVPAQRTADELAKLGKPAVDVASDYIGAIYRYGLEQIKSSNLEYYEMQNKKFVLTVPAVWSDKAKDLTLRAAKNAGMYPVTLIKEPEAAALYTFHAVKERALAVGDALVVCDAGGGTVDLISYEVLDLSPLKLKELVPGSGAMAGSMILNKRFEELVKNVVGEETFFSLRKTKGFSIAMKTFDQEVKRAFVGDQEQSWYVTFPMARLKDDPANNLEADTLTLTCDAVSQIFEPLISKVEELVTGQVDKVKIKRISDNHPKAKDIKAIFLVGGFGSNHYLKTRLEKSNPGIQVIQPREAWAAIAKGAVLSQLPREVIITSTVAGRHYGVSASYVYDEMEDGGQEKIWDQFEEVHRVMKMAWYIHMGEDLIRDHRVEFAFFRKLPLDYEPYQLIFHDELLCSETIEAIKYPKDGITKVNCTLTADLRGIPRHNFKNKRSPTGREYVSIGYNLVIETKNANMEFFMEMNGKVMSCVKASYDGNDV